MPQRIYQGCCHYHHLYHEQGDCHGQKLKALASSVTDNQLTSTIKESTQQIWLAGLGAYAKAQEEGGKIFEALVQEGKPCKPVPVRAQTRRSLP